jgi:hypothetical protein
VPKFWEEQDGRYAVAREIRSRVQRLREDAGADSFQKDVLCQRAVFIALQLESMEIAAVESGKFDPGSYTQMVNCLVGLLRSLGLERKAKTIGLDAYLGGKAG